MTNNTNITDLPYSVWLEQTLHDIVELPVTDIAIAAVLEDGGAYTNYFKCPMINKLQLAGLIQQDAMMDTLAANGVVEYEEDEEEDEEDADDGEEEE